MADLDGGSPLMGLRGPEYVEWRYARSKNVGEWRRLWLIDSYSKTIDFSNLNLGNNMKVGSLF
jgi:hypothetical protein